MSEPTALELQLAGYRLATAEILYRLPDHPAIVQSYIWQEYDIAPDYPELKRFLDFWTRELEGPLFSVRVAGKQIISAAEYAAGTLFRLH